MLASASAPGKIIITGEHFVVHGATAVAAALDLRARVSVKEYSGSESCVVSGTTRSSVTRFPGINAIITKASSEFGQTSKKLIITVESDIPRGAGLGSSSAVSVSTAAAICKFYEADDDRNFLSLLASEGEKAVHGNPSGIDLEASLKGGIFLFSKSEGSKQIPLERDIEFVVTDSGVKRKTRDLISKVTDFRNKYPRTFEKLSDSVSYASLEVSNALSQGEMNRVGAIINLVQSSLRCVGVSTPELESLLEYSLNEDVFGAKLTGAGGGGSILILPKNSCVKRVSLRMEESFGRTFVARIPQEGLRWSA